MEHNMLVDCLPETIEIEGTDYEIETNFRTYILLELMMQDTELSDVEKAMRGLELVYHKIPENLNSAVDGLLWFYSCGKQWREKKAGEVEEVSEIQRIYSFEYDDDYIYSAFLTQYHIDLQDIEYLHWWKFKALMRTLSSDLEFSKIMEYRSIDINSNMTKEQRDFYRRKKELYALPLPADEEEKMDAIAEALMNDGNLAGLL